VTLLRENGECPFAAVIRFVRGLPSIGFVVMAPPKNRKKGRLPMWGLG
jgi:hypothetical protein